MLTIFSLASRRTIMSQTTKQNLNKLAVTLEVAAQSNFQSKSSSSEQVLNTRKLSASRIHKILLYSVSLPEGHRHRLTRRNRKRFHLFPMDKRES